MPIRVDSEIGRLRRVLVHRPGLEIDRMTPPMMGQLLFDDILDGDEARGEHTDFTAVLSKAGVEVLDAQDLLAAALEDADARAHLTRELAEEYGVGRALLDRLGGLAAGELARTLIEGVRAELPPPGRRPRRLFLFDLSPVPNYFFQRDPQVVLGRRVMISSMATDARERERLLARLIFQHHPELSREHEGLMEIDAPSEDGSRWAQHQPYATLEGGDVLVASPRTVVVGASERTNRSGVEELAEYLRSEATDFRHLILVDLPSRRSYMHLDTVFTFIDRGVCLAYPPVVEPGSPESAHVYHVDLSARALAFSVRRSLRHALAEVGQELELVPCGGPELLDQQREQWTDGANAFAVAPGAILLYRRNRKTLEELDRRGWRVLGEEDVLDGGEEFLGHGPTVVSIPGYELSRARGGPRCMTMPLERDGAGS
jgi:arginine deiminase